MRNAALADSEPLLTLFDRSDTHHLRVAAYLPDHPDTRLLTTACGSHRLARLGVEAVLTINRADFDLYRLPGNRRFVQVLGT